MSIIFPHFVQSSVDFFDSSLDDAVGLVADGSCKTPTFESLSCFFFPRILPLVIISVGLVADG